MKELKLGIYENLQGYIARQIKDKNCCDVEEIGGFENFMLGMYIVDEIVSKKIEKCVICPAKNKKGFPISLDNLNEIGEAIEFGSEHLGYKIDVKVNEKEHVFD